MTTIHHKSKFAERGDHEALHSVSDDGQVLAGKVGDTAHLRSAADKRVMIATKVARVIDTATGPHMFHGEIVRFFGAEDDISFDGMRAGDSAEFDIVQVFGLVAS